jgi:hypothetical protein
MPKASLLEEVRANLPSRERPTWIKTVPAELRDELEQIRDDWRAGRMGDVTKTGLARAISISVNARGIRGHILTVVRWLDG